MVYDVTGKLSRFFLPVFQSYLLVKHCLRITFFSQLQQDREGGIKGRKSQRKKGDGRRGMGEER
jgi:rRNA processing protein Gar1